MRHITKLSLLLVFVLATSIMVSAQDEEAPKVNVLNCEDGAGCTRTESNLTQQEAEVLLGEAPEGADAPFIVCADGMGCIWSQLPAEDADLLFGGDGVDDLVFDEDEGLEVLPSDEKEESEAEDDLIFTEEEVAEFTEALCNGAEDCSWAELTPNEINSLFPQFEGVAYQIVPKAGTWQGASFPPVLNGCPAGVADALAGYTVTEMATLDMGDEFDINSLMVIDGATVTNPSPNVYSIFYSPDASVVVRFVYLIQSEEHIRANMLFIIDVPGAFTCSATVDFAFDYIG